MFTKLNKANGYYAGKSYGTFQTGTTKTGGNLLTPTTTKTGGSSFIFTNMGPQSTTTKTEDKTEEKSSTLKWVIIIAVVAVGGYFLYKHYKH